MRVIAAAALGLCAMMLASCSATPPGRAETAVMTRIKRWTTGGRKLANPQAATTDNIAAGRDAFSHYCAACHGLDGQKTGVPFADHMSPPVPSLSAEHVQQYKDGQLKRIIDEGIGPSGMPGSKGILNDDEIWSIVLYIRHLPPAGSLGEPAMYSGEDCAQKDQTTGR
jgi:mono/diheme cytochrome c family protein